MLQWIQQPQKTKLCGQIAVAVIANITLEKSIELFGKRGCTRTKDVIQVLRRLGLDCSNRLLRKQITFGIAKLSYKNSKSHWVVIDNNKIFDGVYGNSNGEVSWPEGARLTSYLSIKNMQE